MSETHMERRLREEREEAARLRADIQKRKQDAQAYQTRQEQLKAEKKRKETLEIKDNLDYIINNHIIPIVERKIGYYYGPNTLSHRDDILEIALPKLIDKLFKNGKVHDVDIEKEVFSVIDNLSKSNDSIHQAIENDKIVQEERKRAEEERIKKQEESARLTEQRKREQLEQFNAIFKAEIESRIEQYIIKNYGEELIIYKNSIVDEARYRVLHNLSYKDAVINHRLFDADLSWIMSDTIAYLSRTNSIIKIALNKITAKKRAKEEQEKQIKLEQERQAKIIQFRNNYEKKWGNHEVQHTNLCKSLSLNTNLPNYLTDTSARVISIITDLEAAKLLNTDAQPDNIETYKKVIELTKHRLFQERGNRTVNKTKLQELFDEGNIAELERYLRHILANSFVRLVNNHTVDIENKGNLIFVYENTTGKTYKPRSTPGKTSEMHRAHKERGYLDIYDGKIIVGGENRRNQGQIDIKLCNEALQDLCELVKQYYGLPHTFGISDLTSSHINGYMEDCILLPKSQRADWNIIDERAMKAFMLRRDKRTFTDIQKLFPDNKFKRIYFGSEYKKYLEMFIGIYENTPKIKDSITAIANTIIYEHLIMMSNYTKFYV